MVSGLRRLREVFILLFLTSSLHAQDLYWVGGSGDWNDASHWSLSSNGAGGAGIPNTGNNVIFDSNSFKAPGLTLTASDDIYFKSMSWTAVTNNPTFAGSEALTAVCDGSIRFSAGMNHQFLGSYRMQSTQSGNVITSSGQRFHKDLVFDGANGAWSLSDSLYVNRSLDISRGTFNSADKSVDVFNIFSRYNTARTINLGTSRIWIRQRMPGPPSTFIIGGTNLSFQGASSQFDFSGDSSRVNFTATSALNVGTMRFRSPRTIMSSAGTAQPTISQLRFDGNATIYGNHTIGDWTLTNGFLYLLQNGTTQTVDRIITGDDCNGLVSVMAFIESDVQANIKYSFVPLIQDGAFYMRGIRNPDNVGVQLFNSQDGGNNSNWVFQNLTPRNLYWVGGSGNWNDKNHWSNTSGGSGGACIPRPTDNVFFDNGSFKSSTDTVFGAQPGFCNNFSYSVTNFLASLQIPSLFVNNDLLLNNQVVWGIRDVYFIGNDIGGNNDQQLIQAGPNLLINITSNSKRVVSLAGPLTLTGTLDIRGSSTFSSSGYSLTANSIKALDSRVDLDLRNSYVLVTGSRSGLSMPLTIANVRLLQTTNTRIELSSAGSGIEAQRGPLGSVYFSNPSGVQLFRSLGNVAITSLRFAGSGQLLEQTLSIDSLFFSPGKNYEIVVGTNITVNKYFESPGGSCLPIGFRSAGNGFQAEFKMPNSARILVEYTEIRDLKASGGNSFQTGVGSRDLGNNSGWKFPNDSQNNELKRFLGNDFTACSDSSILLTPFSQSEITSILWKSGSTDLSYSVPNNISRDTVIARVTFPNSCQLSDTVIVTRDPAFSFNLGRDTSLCAGEQLILATGVSQASYLWSTGATTSTIAVNTTGSYHVLVSKGACRFRDTLALNVIQLPAINLGRDTVLCQDQNLRLSGPPTTAMRLWSDGTTGAQITVNNSGSYWLQLSSGRCSAADTVNVSFDQKKFLNLGRDTILCESETLQLQPGFPNSSYLWSTGSTADNIQIQTAGTYSLRLTSGACVERDTIQVSYNLVQPFDLGKDTTLCEGQSLNLTATPAANESIRWSDGSTQPSFPVSSAGLYWLDVSKGRCVRTDSIRLNIDLLKKINLGRDTTLCETETLLLQPGFPNSSYLWSTGSTADNILIQTAGTYSLRLTSGACVERDTIQVSYNLVQPFDLGKDTILCEGQSLNLTATPGAGESIRWSDGSTQPSFPVSSAGLYWLDVSKGRCVRTDSIRLSVDPLTNLNLGRDTVLCETETLQLQPGVPNSSYLWSDGSTANNLQIESAGEYSLRLTSGACIERDTIRVDYNLIPAFDLGRDSILCEGQIISLQAPSISNELINWSDGSSSNSLSVQNTGQYWLELSLGRCTQADTISVSFDPLQNLSLGPDTTLCESETLNISLNHPASTFSWSDGSTANMLNINTAGQYWLELGSGACIERDTIDVSYISIAQFDLGPDTTLCEGQSLSLQGPAGNTELFNWSDGSSQQNFNVQSSGLYWLSLSNGRCQLSDSILVSFDAKQFPELGSDTTLCEDEFLDLALNIGGAQYNWSNGSSGDSIRVSNAGNYSVIVQTGQCIEYDTIRIDYNIIADFSLGPDTSFCEGESFQLLSPAVPGVTYSWPDLSFGPQLNIDQSGLYYLNAAIGRCTKTDSINIQFDTFITTDIGNDTTLCAGETLQLDASVPELFLLGGEFYEWNNGTSGAFLTVSQEGPVVIQATNGACEAMDSIYVSYTLFAPLDIGADATLCEGDTLQLAVPAGSVGTPLWSTGETSPAITVQSSGEYFLTLSEGRCSISDSIQIGVDPVLNIDLGRDTILCEDESLLLRASQSGASYLWSSGSTADSLYVDRSGTYFVNASRGVCRASDTIRVSYVTLSDLDLGADTTLCEGELLSLDADIGIGLSYLWQDNSSLSSYQVSNPGYYTVVVSSDRCFVSDSIQVSYDPAITIDLGQDSTLCLGETLELDASTAGATYLWNDNSTNALLNVTVGGSYFVRLTRGACMASDSISLVFQTPPQVSLPRDTSTCEGEIMNLDFDEDLLNINYLWSDGSTGSSFQTNAPGTYSVMLDDGICQLDFQTVVSFDTIPKVELGPDVTFCRNQTGLIGLQTNPGPYLYYWNTGSNNEEILPGSSGKYFLYAQDQTGCTGVDSIQVTIVENPSFDLGQDTTLCEGQAISFDITRAGGRYLWSDGSRSPVNFVSSKGIFWGELVVNNCSFRDSIAISVQSYPVVDIGNDTIICEGEELMLNALTPNAIYLWSTQETSSSILVSQPGNYSVDVSIEGCTSSSSLTLANKPVPMVDLGPDRTICEGDQTDLHVEVPGAFLNWSNGQTGNRITVNQAGNYRVTADLNGCKTSDELQLSIQALPVFDLGPDIAICEDLGIDLFVDLPNVTVNWNTGDQGKNLLVQNPGLFVATATTNLGCTYEDEIVISNRECVRYVLYAPNIFSPNSDGRNDEYRVFVPSEVRILDFNLRIFDRWGSELFFTRDISQGWDGRFNGKELGPGVYNYMVDVRYEDDFESGVRERKGGNFTLIR